MFYSNRAAKQELGWSPAIPLPVAISKTVGKSTTKRDHLLVGRDVMQTVHAQSAPNSPETRK